MSGHLNTDINPKAVGGAIMSGHSGPDAGYEYRYLLWRRMVECDQKRRALFIMLNPSTADANVDDHTVRKGMGFCRRWNAGLMMFMNAFALRSTDPDALLAHALPVGLDNDAHLRSVLGHSGKIWRVIVAWGRHESVVRSKRDVAVFEMIKAAGHQAWCLGTNKDGSPRHPLTLGYATELVPWAAP